MKPLRLALIGCGDVARFYMAVARQLREGGLAEVVAACDLDEAKRQRARTEFGVPHVAADWPEILALPQVEAVLVLTPDHTHGVIARAALEAGKHVLVEKPMTVVLDAANQTVDLEKSLAEAARLVALAKQGPAYLMCAPFVALSPTFEAIWQRLQRGEIGKVFNARARYGTRMPNYAWLGLPGNSPLFNGAVYNLTTLTGWLGPVKRVMAMTGVAYRQHRLRSGATVNVEIEEDNGQLLLDFGEASFASVTTGWTMQKYRSPAIELYGESGTIQMLGDDWAPAGYELWRNEIGAWQIFEETAPNWPWADGLRRLAECARNGTPPTGMLDHAFHVYEVVLKLKASSRTGAAQPVHSTFPWPLTPPTG